MSGEGQGQSRITVAQVGAEVDELRTEVAELRQLVDDIAEAVKPRLDRLARRRAAASDK